VENVETKVSNDALNWRHIIAGWAILLPIIVVSIAGLNSLAYPHDLTQRNVSWDGVVNPRHDPAAIRGMEDVKEDAR
jgi:hypothetical protein